jgi:hypothetical protein
LSVLFQDAQLWSPGVCKGKACYERFSDAMDITLTDGGIETDHL